MFSEICVVAAALMCNYIAYAEIYAINIVSNIAARLPSPTNYLFISQQFPEIRILF